MSGSPALIHVNVQNGYDICIERGVLPRSGKHIRFISGAEKAMIISDSHVAPLYLNTVAASLERYGFAVTRHIFPAGESHKTTGSVVSMVEALAKAGLSRGDIVVALGGGVTGDLAGFAAGIYLRGIDFVQIPTTLLSQIDSSVGGKVGCDLPQGKNLAGCFYQPRLVLIDPEALRTLPPRFFADGVGEGLKYGCISDPSLFGRWEKNEGLDEKIARCVEIKQKLVEQDEKESGPRRLLNFGHTLGHAIEKYYHFEGFSHGEAVAIGMAMITAASEKAGLTEPGTAARLREALLENGLPVSCEAPVEELCALCAGDKKRIGKELHLALISEIGKGFLHTIPFAAFYDFIKEGIG